MRKENKELVARNEKLVARNMELERILAQIQESMVPDRQQQEDEEVVTKKVSKKRSRSHTEKKLKDDRRANPKNTHIPKEIDGWTWIEYAGKEGRRRSIYRCDQCAYQTYPFSTKLHKCPKKAKLQEDDDEEEEDVDVMLEPKKEAVQTALCVK